MNQISGIRTDQKADLLMVGYAEGGGVRQETTQAMFKR